MSKKKTSKQPEASEGDQATSSNAGVKALIKKATAKEPKPKKMSCLDDHFTNA
jgi:hypothetical protein